MVDQPGRFISRVGVKKITPRLMIAAKTSRATTGSATKAGLEWKGLNKSSNGNGGGGKMFDEARIAKLRSKWISLTRGTEGGTPV